MNTYTIFFFTGETMLIKGFDFFGALEESGTDKSAIGTIDFFVNGDKRKDYFWDKKKKEWKSKKLLEEYSRAGIDKSQL